MATDNSDPSNVSGPEKINRGERGPLRANQKANQKTVWLWLGANVLGFAIATPLSFLMNVSAQYFEALYIAGLIVGAVVGPLQALVMQRLLPRLKIWQWVIANIFGSYLGSWVGLLVFGLIVMLLQFFNNLPDPGDVVTLVLTIAIYSAVIGMCVSIAQLYSLPSQVQNARQWWIANFLGRILGWVSASLVGWFVFAITGTENFLVVWGALLGAVGGAVYAGVTTKALLNLQPNAVKT
ncbi:hypothetical protein Lepto7375DRAFT_5379 [Leptolyngbya sp. PCC 7375]|nr:hypothetical protein Lepto7375DRAFT_5379 [Leptolyngbya sp. PCC 7375]